MYVPRTTDNPNKNSQKSKTSKRPLLRNHTFLAFIDSFHISGKLKVAKFLRSCPHSQTASLANNLLATDSATK